MPSPLVPRDPPMGRVSIKKVPDTNGTAVILSARRLILD